MRSRAMMSDDDAESVLDDRPSSETMSTVRLERRGSERRRAYALASFCPLAGGARRGATIRDIGRRGLMIELVEGALTPGLEISIDVPPQSGLPRLGAICTVRWCVGRRVGLEIEAMSPQHRARLERLVEGGETCPALTSGPLTIVD